MNLRKRFLQFLLAGVVGIVLSATPLLAIPVTFSTSGVFSGTGTNTITFGGGGNELMLTFSGVAATVNAPTNTSFGDFTATVMGTGAAIAPPQTFTLNISQTVPSAGAGLLQGSVTGTISVNSSTGQLSVTIPSTTIGLIVYQLNNQNYLLVPPNTNNGLTTIQGTVTVIPEPASMFLLAAGLLVVGSVRFGRKKV